MPVIIDMIMLDELKNNYRNCADFCQNLNRVSETLPNTKQFRSWFWYMGSIWGLTRLVDMVSKPDRHFIDWTP